MESLKSRRACVTWTIHFPRQAMPSHHHPLILIIILINILPELPSKAQRVSTCAMEARKLSAVLRSYLDATGARR
jgi:hypothetical protein